MKVAGVILAGSLAGCSGIDTGPDATDSPDSDSDDSDDLNTEEPTETSQYPEEPADVGKSGMQRTFTNEVSTIEVRAIEEVDVSASEEIVLDLTLQNTSDEPVPLHEYGVAIYLYKSEEPGDDSQEMGYTGTSSEFNEDNQEPTESDGFATLRYSTQVSNNSGATIQSYHVDIGCFMTSGDLPGC